MAETIRDRRQAAAWERKHDATAPKPGDLAADFALLDAEGTRNTPSLWPARASPAAA
ncbi:MAG: hypothetical protein JRI25_11630 [Deltaproteobacteria bacterium]|nr:hypothetical protein [Deltaproteobacteria bacterium]MBW2255236.1 hypothetical protein [Deltaproteobacteria bacterium]